jgi:predicted nucleic acid-binding protein
MNDLKLTVSNTGPLISLEKLTDGYKFIRNLYDKVIVPPAVIQEVSVDQFNSPDEYLKYYGIKDLLEIHPVSNPKTFPEMERLHDGETEAIQLALELKLPLLIEETLGRQIANSLGISISGIAGQIIKAFRQGIITASEAQEKLRELLENGRINQKIYEELTVAIPKS